MLVTKEQAIKLKKMGFDREVFTIYENRNSDKVIDCSRRNYNKYENDISAPTVSEALDFMREEKGLECAVMLAYEANLLRCFYYGEYITQKNESHALVKHANACETYTEASIALLDAVIKYIEEYRKQPTQRLELK